MIIGESDRVKKNAIMPELGRKSKLSEIGKDDCRMQVLSFDLPVNTIITEHTSGLDRKICHARD